jgi:hypothetical protein
VRPFNGVTIIVIDNSSFNKTQSENQALLLPDILVLKKLVWEKTP